MNMIPTIGMETHVELNTNSKMFCNCPVVETEDPNISLCPTCLGLPGALPVPNLKAIESITMLALSANCSITNNGMFHRKNYFYPDLPKNYQISQFDLPVGVNGSLEIILDEGIETVEIERVHMEEDTGKSKHKGSGRIDSATSTLLDFNRSGVPLVEIVTKPVIKSSKEAVSYIEELRQLVIDLGISEGKLEKGNLRFDANISVAKEGDKELGVKVEIKKQILEKEKRLPDAIIACLGGGSNLIGAIHEFLDDKEVELYGVEAENSAALTNGSVGIMQGFKSFMLQSEDGSETLPTSSLASGINFYSAGPEHAYLKSIGRVNYTYATDEKAFEAFQILCKTEGILPAFEPSFALAKTIELAKTMPGKILVCNICGRGDKDIDTAEKMLGNKLDK